MPPSPLLVRPRRSHRRRPTSLLPLFGLAVVVPFAGLGRRDCHRSPNCSPSAFVRRSARSLCLALLCRTPAHALFESRRPSRSRKTAVLALLAPLLRLLHPAFIQ